MKTKIELGDEVEDLITGFRGVAVARTVWITGCTRINVTPKVKAGATDIGETLSFDEPTLKIVSRAKKSLKDARDTDGSTETKKEVTGGPRPAALKGKNVC